ncbi:hypothetical protein ACL90Y_11905 [Micrococcus luteus]
MRIVVAARVVYTWEPWALYAAAFLALAGGVALFAWGRRRAQRERESIRTREASASAAGPRRTLDRDDWRRLRRWELVRGAGVVTACGFLVLGFLGLHARDVADMNLRANLLDAYQPALLAADEVKHVAGGYLVELHWTDPSAQSVGVDGLGTGEYDAIVVPDVLVTVKDRRYPTVTQIPEAVLREWAEDAAHWPAADR